MKAHFQAFYVPSRDVGISGVLRVYTPRYIRLSVGRSIGPSVGRLPFWAAALKGPMTSAVFIWASRVELGSRGWDRGLEALIRALRLGFQLRGWDFSFKAEI